MNASQIMQLLWKKAQASQLAHFYVLTAMRPSPTSQVQLTKWTEDFLAGHYRQVERIASFPKNVRDFADLLWISPVNDEGEQRDYKVEDLEELSSFLSYRAISAKQRFVVLENVDAMTALVANKLLKTLEEPPTQTTFLFLNPTDSALLPTITSRALQLRLPFEQQTTTACSLFDEVTKKIEQGQYSLAQFLEECRSKKMSEDELLAQWIAFETLHPDGNLHRKQELLELLPRWSVSERFNQMAVTRQTWLYAALGRYQKDRSEH